MRGVDLNIFEFDYDLTWAGFFVEPDGTILGRYGGRDEGPAEAHLSLAGLRTAMQRALVTHRDLAGTRPWPAGKPRTVEDFPTVPSVEKQECIHCHQVNDLRREELQRKGEWSVDRIWEYTYPPPKNVGLTLDVDLGALIDAVAAGSPADEAGLQAGDVLETVGETRVNSYADLQYALHRAPQEGMLDVAWLRGGQRQRAQLGLEPGWRKSDISWRGSMWGLPPTAGVYGKDLSSEEKRRLGLDENRLAFYMGDYVPPPAANAGIRQRDVILGIDDLELEMTMLQFNAYVRLNYQVGDMVTYNVVREGKRLDIPMRLSQRDF